MLKKALIITGSLLVLIIGFLFWYDWRYSMDVVEGFEINAPDSEEKVLIASQGSDFKNAVVDQVADYLEDRGSYVRLIDVTTIGDVKVSEWDAIVVIHTWEIWEPQADAKEFLHDHYDSDKVVVLATSGAGDEMIEGINGISGASIMKDVDGKAKMMIEQIAAVLDKSPD